jgi:ketosteroid isomerase-like protein
VNAGVSGDLAYLVGFEHRTIDAAGAVVPHTLRVTFIYRRDASQWKLVHRHSDISSIDVARAPDELRLT